LLGVMSRLRFDEVSTRFIQDLSNAQRTLSVKGVADPKLAAKTSLLVQSMRWLRIRHDPEDAWDLSCETMQLLARFFAEVHGREMKYAYTELFEQLLLPLAASATHFSSAKWKNVLQTLRPKVTQMLSKADHWPFVFPLHAVLLCVSPMDVFASQWLSVATYVHPNRRDRAARSHILKATCRLTWRYLYKMADSPNAVARKLDEIIKLVFQGGKRMQISMDPAIADPLIQLIRIIGYKEQDLCFRTIIFPLMNSELFLVPDSQLKIESLDPEKTVIAIRAFLAIMADLEKGEPPPFPSSFECDALFDAASRAPVTHRRTRSQGFAVSAGRTERLSRPVITTNLNPIAKEYYVKFCKILGQLTMICDNTFGGQAVLDEKFASHTPKTPMAEAFTFNRKDDPMNPTDLRQHYYDLLHVAVEALPRCLSPHLPINSLVNLLCTGTAHVQSHIATSSAQSLKAIARQSHAQQVTIGFARFIFNFDDRYATVSDGGLLGPGHIETTLKLYVELLQIWIDEIQLRTRKAAAPVSDDIDSASKPLPLDLSGVLAHVDEVESHGLFFLCSPSRSVRAIAVNVLRLINKFDTALGKPITRIISILEGGSQRVIDVNDDRLSLAERSRLQKGLRRISGNNTLVELCSSDIAHDTNLWFKIFPNLVRLSSEICPHAVALTQEIVCLRLAHTHRIVLSLAEGAAPRPTPFESAFAAAKPMPVRVVSNSPDVIIEQWKLHLIFACTTLTNKGSSLPVNNASQVSLHTRKTSKSSSLSNGHDKAFSSAGDLFDKVKSMLSVPSAAVRNAAVIGLGASNINIFTLLLESLHAQVLECGHDAKERIASHQRSMSSPKRSRRVDHLRVSLTHLFSLTSPLLRDPIIEGNEFVLDYVTSYAKHLRLFLSDTEVQNQLEYQKLRTYYCTLTDGLYECIKRLKDSSKWLSFQARQATFSLMENWCGFSPNEGQLVAQQDHMARVLTDREQDYRGRATVSSQIEKETSELQSAALSAMAALCAGPLSFTAEGKVLMSFDIKRMLQWLNAIFRKPSDRTHAIGRKALANLIVSNPDHPTLMAQTLRMCYIASSSKEESASKALTSYFEVVTKVLTEHTHVQAPFWKVLCAGLYTLGNEDNQIRFKSVKLLRTLEERQGKTSKLQDLDISVSDKTTAVYKLAQFEISCRLAKQHPELAFHVFSEFSLYFNDLQPDHQRNMVSGMLPWIQTIELQIDPNGGVTAPSYMLLVNLFEITVKSRVALHNEIQALWQALATGPYAGNVQLVLDFIIAICLDRKEQNFVVYAKQIVVFLSGTAAGAKVVEYLLLQICPKTMVAERREPIVAPHDATGLPYIADLVSVLPSGAKQSGLSLGQLSMVLLVDLIVSPNKVPNDQLATLLQVILVQWDQYIAIVQDQARELLVHLIHELVISKIEPGRTDPDKDAIEDFIESVRQHDPKIAWNYGDSEVKAGEEDSRAVTEPMGFVVDQVVRIFAITHPTIRQDWGRVTMTWATSCAVRHVACRSFQVFRCIQTSLDSQMLADMLARLSNTIADDENHDYLIFSLEILTTLRSIIDALDPLSLLKYPQLFWTTCACLDTIFEREFQEGLSMLGHLLKKLDLSDPAVLKLLQDNQPEKWEGSFQGLHTLMYKGVRSSKSMARSLAAMETLIKFPSGPLVGADDRLLFTVLANLPRLLHHFEDITFDMECTRSAEVLANVAEQQNFVALAKTLHSFASLSFRSADDFLGHIIPAIRTAYFPALEFQSLIFLLGMVNNSCDWFKVKTMQVLCVILPEVDMRKPEIASQGPDLISPLLRLLQTEHCQQALDVLDNVIDMTGTPMDNKHLRMSMAGSHSSRATRKEYDRTKSLYGIPEESGWCIPIPAIHSAQTRANVHAVFYTLAYAGLAGIPEAVSTPDVEFHRDDYMYDSSMSERTGTMMTDDTRLGSNMGELAMKLDSLDDFFDEDEQSGSESYDYNGRPRYPSALIEQREDIYDQQALPILHNSLKRNISVTAFQTGFADPKMPTAIRDPAPPMTPGAFATHSAAMAARPGLHTRAMTSSAAVGSEVNTSHYHHNGAVHSSDEGFDGPFSDDDSSLNRAHTSDEASYAATTDANKTPVARRGWRSGLRRLTSSGGRESRDQLKGQMSAGLPMAKSPRVPRVPAAFLRDPMSAEP
ncbi:Cell morphogenesis protein PAG1, partial [Oleoguttula sp. CCFEE 5521]